MPVFAQVKADVPCPACGVDLAIGGRIAFQWGHCAVPWAGDGEAYQIGDPLRWKTSPDGEIRSWVYFRDGSGNFGDPAYRDVLVRESEHDIDCCSSCHAQLQGIAVLIRRGFVTEVRACTESLPKAAISLVQGDSLEPRPEWDDHSMTEAQSDAQSPGRYWVKGVVAMVGYTLLNGLAVFVPFVPGMLTLFAWCGLFPLIACGMIWGMLADKRRVFPGWWVLALVLSGWVVCLAWGTLSVLLQIWSSI